MERAKTAGWGLFGTASSMTSVGVSVEAQVEAWLRILVLLAGLVSALVSIYWIHRLNRVKVQRESDKLCSFCQDGHPPKHCPLPATERPDNCPLNRNKRKHDED